jgi:hypothetical protein
MSELERVARDGYDRLIGLELDDLSLDGCLTKAPCGGEQAGRNAVDRGNAWQNAHRKPMICTERRARVIEFWISLANAIIIVPRPIRRSWATYRWDTRPPRRP